MLIRSRSFQSAELERFRAYQRESYALLESVARTIVPGESERAVAARIRRAYARLGVRGYFHVPIALFGARTAYPGDFGQFEALPTDRVYQVGEPVILDAAPLFDGFTVDTSLAVSMAPNPAFDRADALLAELRRLILERVRERRSMQKIAHEVDDRIRAAGMENCHRKHIAAVLGHRVTRVPEAAEAALPRLGLTPLPVGWFFATTALARAGVRRLTPNWNHSRSSDVPPQAGLWAVEPHVGLEGTGVKFEEILVIEQDGAYWLDEELPHCRRWGVRAQG